MNNLPKDWVVSRLADLCDIIMGQSPPANTINEKGIGLPFFQGKAEFGTIFPRNLRFCETPVRHAEKNDILMSVRAPVGPTNLAAELCGFGRGLCAIRSLQSSSRFVFYQLRFLEEQISALGTGSTFAAIGRKDVEDIDIAIAPVAEQSYIVEKLEELFSDLDAGVAELKDAQKKMAQYRQSLLKAAVEGTLTAEWRDSRAKHDEPLETGAQLLKRLLIERRQRWEEKQLAKFAEQDKTPPKDWKDKYPEPVQPDTSELPELPKGWAWASVEQLGHVQLGRQRSPSKLTGINSVKYIRAANVTEAGINFSDVLEMDFTETEQETFRLKPGDVLLTEASGSPEHVGRPAIWPDVKGLYCFQNTVIRFTPLLISSQFSFRLFQAWQKLGKFIGIAGGVGINHLSAGKFSSIVAPLPPLEEQEAIATILDDVFAQVNEQEKSIVLGLRQAEAQYKNILKAAFSGQLVAQDPNDEPASVLLERIRAEREERALLPKPRKAKVSKQEVQIQMKKLVNVLAEAGDWLTAQEAFRRCGVADETRTDRIEELYAELRILVKAKPKRVEVKRVENSDMLKLIAKAA